MVIINKSEIDSLSLFDVDNRKTITEFINVIDSMPFKKGKIFSEQSELFCFAQEYETHSFRRNGWESHKVYFDVQYIQKGQELVYYNPNELIIVQHYDENTDCELAEADNGDHAVIKEGDVVIFSPGEYHNTGVTLSNDDKTSKIVRKFVIKYKK